jgi:hypothetical protein
MNHLNYLRPFHRRRGQQIGTMPTQASAISIPSIFGRKLAVCWHANQ